MGKFLDKLTIDQYGKVRFAKEFICQKEPQIETLCDEKKIWFLDAPAYGNLGDQAIAYAIHCFCEYVLPGIKIIEFQEQSVIQYLSWLKRNVKNNDVIVLQGGGNLGNLYPRYEFVRRTLVRTFQNNEIIIFPQSVFFSDDKEGKYETEIDRKIYGKNKRLTMFARDSVSFAEMKNRFPETHVELCPDIVFFLNGIIGADSKGGLGVCMRNDRERTISDGQVKKIMAQIKVHDEKIKQFDTVVDVSSHVIGEYRKSLVLNKLEDFAKCELIVTDRLHGMIFSYITSTPCIAIANSTGKSQYAYNDWLLSSDNVVFVQSCFDRLAMPQKVKSSNLDFHELKKVLLSK